MMKILSMLLLCQISWASGDRVGNGGGAWVCENEQKTIAHGQLVDLFEATGEFGFSLIHLPLATPQAFVQERQNFLTTNWPEMATTLAPYFTEVASITHYVNTDLEHIDDCLDRVMPLPISCSGSGMKWQYEQFANFNDALHELLIRNDMWTSSQISDLDKAGLIWHEAIYRWMRVQFADNNSIRARQLVGIFFSSLSINDMKAKVQDVLAENTSTVSGPTPVVPADHVWLCMTRAESTGAWIPGYAETETKAKFNALNACQNQLIPSSCLEEDTRCSAIDPTGADHICNMRDLSTNRAFQAEGNSALEAELNVLQKCMAAGGAPSVCQIEQCE